MIADQFRILAEPMRLRLLHSLQPGERTVSDLVGITGAAQANVSKHLSILMKAGMVGRRKEGLNAFYSITNPAIFELCNLVCNRLQDDFARKAAHFG